MRTTTVRPTTVATPATESPPPTEPPTDPSGPTDAPTPSPVPEQLKLISIAAPVQSEIGESVLYQFTVENRGQEIQTFEPSVSLQTADSNWTVHDQWEQVRVAPGEQQTFESSPLTSKYLAAVTLRIDGFDTSFSIEFTDKRLQFRTTYRDPRDRVISVLGTGTRTSYPYTNDFGDRRSAEAGEGQKWLLATVTVENRSTRSLETPQLSTFSLHAGDVVYHPVRIRGENAYETRRIPRRETERGWVGFLTPDTLDKSNGQIRWIESFEMGEVGVLWQP